MSYGDIVAETDIERIERKLDYVHDRQDKLVEAVNGLGRNVQWIIDNVQGIFQMFQSPGFMANLPAMMGGVNPAAMQHAVNAAREDSDDGASESA